MIDLAAIANLIAHNFAIARVHVPVCPIRSSSTLAACHLVPARSAASSPTTSSPGWSTFPARHGNRFSPLFRNTTDTTPIQNT